MLAIEKPPGPQPHLLFRNLPELWNDPMGTLLDSTERHGDITRYDCGILDALLVNDADAVQHVLQKNYRAYKKSRSYKGIKLVLGNGLLTSEGDHWLHQRKLVQPAFHHAALGGFATMMVQHTETMLAAWRDGGRVDLHRELSKLTFRIVGSTLFGADLDAHADSMGPALDVVLHHAYDYAEQIVPIPPWVPTPANRRFQRAMQVLDDLVERLVAERRREARPRADLFGMLLAATDDGGGEGMSPRQLRDEILTLVLAGHETTANALTFTFYLLARHPAERAKLEAELDGVLDDRPPRLEDVAKLTRTSQVIEESMRLYPPAWGFEREAIEHDELCGYRITPGTIIMISPFTLHRYRRYWPDPERFDPDRFSPERAAGRHRFAYLPFGGGPRVCIGKGFAMMEAKLLVATIARRYRLELVPGYRLDLDPSVTLRPRGGLAVQIAAR